MSDDNLEEYWEALRPAPKPKVINRSGVYAIEESLRFAAEKAATELRNEYKKLNGVPFSSEGMAKLVSLGIEVFMRNWYESLRTKDMTALLAIVLEAQDLSIEELKGFVRALPMTILDRVAKAGSLVDQANGIHALLAVESLWRQGGRMARDYRLEKREGKLFVTIFPKDPNPCGEEMTISLDEMFTIGAGAVPSV